MVLALKAAPVGLAIGDEASLTQADLESIRGNSASGYWHPLRCSRSCPNPTRATGRRPPVSNDARQPVQSGHNAPLCRERRAAGRCRGVDWRVREAAFLQPGAVQSTVRAWDAVFPPRV